MQDYYPHVGIDKANISLFDAALADDSVRNISRITPHDSRKSIARAFVLNSSAPDRGGRVGVGMQMPGFKKRDNSKSQVLSKSDNSAVRHNTNDNGGKKKKKKKKTGGDKSKGSAWTEEKKRAKSPEVANTAREKRSK